tara:strand:+ start:7206 stop:7577 length:372 start_codon:yes stop_codon:yes gene_type:complete
MEKVVRDLTEEELKLAPDWATHYIVDSDESIIYESEKLCWWEGLRDPLNNERSFGNLSNRTIKPFDISKHKFSDRDISMETLASDYLCLHLDGKAPYVAHSKKDAIAIAKSLCVTGEDLKAAN